MDSDTDKLLEKPSKVLGKSLYLSHINIKKIDTMFMEWIKMGREKLSLLHNDPRVFFIYFWWMRV
jgi:hypothetical protein